MMPNKELVAFCNAVDNCEWAELPQWTGYENKKYLCQCERALLKLLAVQGELQWSCTADSEGKQVLHITL